MILHRNGTLASEMIWTVKITCLGICLIFKFARICTSYYEKKRLQE